MAFFAKNSSSLQSHTGLSFWKRLPAWLVGKSQAENRDIYGKGVIRAAEFSEQKSREFFRDDEKLILEIAKSQYGTKSAWYLREQSHWDFPGKYGSREIIANEGIKRRFLQIPYLKMLKE